MCVSLKRNIICFHIVQVLYYRNFLKEFGQGWKLTRSLTKYQHLFNTFQLVYYIYNYYFVNNNNYHAGTFIIFG